MTENKYKREKELWDDEETKAYVKKIISDGISHLENLNSMSINGKYEQYRIKAIDSYFRNAPEFLKIKKQVDNMDKKQTASKKEDEEPVEEEEVEIQFGN